VKSIFAPDFPLTLPLSPDSGGEGGVRGILVALFMQRLGYAGSKMKTQHLIPFESIPTGDNPIFLPPSFRSLIDNRRKTESTELRPPGSTVKGLGGSTGNVLLTPNEKRVAEDT